MASLLRRVIPKRVISQPVIAYSPSERKVMAPSRKYDVFINHRGVDTKRTVAGLLYDRLVQMGLRPFLDNRTMEPGDNMCQSICGAIHDCKVGIAIFSPRYCDSDFCLQELSMLVEARKKLIPIFYDVKPSELLRLEDLVHSHAGLYPLASPEEMERFKRALREAKYTVGLTFDSQNGNFSDLVSKVSRIVEKSMKEVPRNY